MSDSPPAISLDEARAAKRRGGRKNESDPPDPGGGAPGEHPKGCPVVALGHLDGSFYFLDITGQMRVLKARALASRSDLAALFGGDTDWLFEHFPKTATEKSVVAGETVTSKTIVGFSTALASEFLMRLTVSAGIFGDHLTFRRNGIWRGPGGAPAVHCGGEVLFADGPLPAGQRAHGTVWLSGPPTPRPAKAPAVCSVAEGIQQDVQRLWKFKEPGGAIAVLGLIGTAYYGASAQWRSNGYITGLGGSGKSMLLNLMRAACPLHHYTSDTTKAGIEGAVNGHAMPIFIDEPGDRVDQVGAQLLLDMLLAATGGEGTRGHRGTADGGVRAINLVGAVTMASVNPPDMKPTHRSRLTLIEVEKPLGGEDHKDEMLALIESVRIWGPSLWARALHGWKRWQDCVGVLRAALGRAGCAPREMDQLGSILAGWWVLTRDDVPDDALADREGVAAIAGFVRPAHEVADDDGPRRVMELLMTTLVQYDGTTRQEQVGTLLRRAYERVDLAGGYADSSQAVDTLARHGMRPVRANEPSDKRGFAAPRLGEGDGLWLLPVAVRPLFRNTPFEGDRWQFEVMRIDGAHRSRTAVRVGGAASKAVWLPRAAFDEGDPAATGPP